MNTGKKHPADPSGDLLEVGVVGRAFGLRGQVRLRPYNPESDTLERVEKIILKPDEGSAKTYNIHKIKPHQGVFVAALEGVMNREDAEKLRGSRLCVMRSDLPDLEEDEFYWFQLIGLEVWCSDRMIGRVSAIQETAPELDGNDILVVETDQEEILVPVVRDFIHEIDLDGGRVILEPERGYDTQV